MCKQVTDCQDHNLPPGGPKNKYINSELSLALLTLSLFTAPVSPEYAPLALTCQCPQDQMPRKRGIKTKNLRDERDKNSRRGSRGTHGHDTCLHTSTLAFFLNKGQARVFVSHRESCQSVVLWQRFEKAWVDGSAFARIRNISNYLATPIRLLALFCVSDPT